MISRPRQERSRITSQTGNCTKRLHRALPYDFGYASSLFTNTAVGVRVYWATASELEGGCVPGMTVMVWSTSSRLSLPTYRRRSDSLCTGIVPIHNRGLDLVGVVQSLLELFFVVANFFL